MKKNLIFAALTLGSFLEVKSFFLTTVKIASILELGAIGYNAYKHKTILTEDDFKTDTLLSTYIDKLGSKPGKYYINQWLSNPKSMIGIHGLLAYISFVKNMLSNAKENQIAYLQLTKNVEVEAQKATSKTRIKTHLNTPQQLLLSKEFNQDISSFSEQEQNTLALLTNKINNNQPFSGGGIILYGKPGTGKSFFCATLSILTNIDQLRITPDLIDSDSAIEAVKDICKEYSNRGKKLFVTFEEGELFIKEREGLSSLSERNLLSRILMELESIIKLPHIYCALNTNYPWELGKSGIRAGRFGGSLIEFKFANKAELATIIKKTLNLNPHLIISNEAIAKIINDSQIDCMTKAALNKCIEEALILVNFDKKKELEKLVNDSIESLKKAESLKKLSIFERFMNFCKKTFMKNLEKKTDLYYQNETVKKLTSSIASIEQNSIKGSVTELTQEKLNKFKSLLTQVIQEEALREEKIKSGALNKAS